MPIEITVPGSKSITNRVLILAALSSRTLEIHNVAASTDTTYMLEALKKLGLIIDQKNSTAIISGKLRKNIKTDIYTHNAGTTTRFITALSTLLDSEILIHGDERMHERPIDNLTNALNSIGAQIKTTNNCPPVQIHPKIPTGGIVEIPGEISSQYISAILLISPFLKNDTQINIIGDLCSRPYVDITIKVLNDFGLEVSNHDYKYFKIPGNQKAKKIDQYTIESDASSASYPAAYSALHKNTKVKLKNINKDSIQGDIKFLNYLSLMGCKITEDHQDTIIEGPEKLQPLGEIDMNSTPDLVMTFAVLSAFAEGKTKITNISNLKIKETDRLQALENELTKLGSKVKTGNDFIEIEGGEALKGNVEINTYNDHRMAMSFGILLDLIPGLSIENPSCVEKSYRSFWDDLQKLTNYHLHN